MYVCKLSGSVRSPFVGFLFDVDKSFVRFNGFSSDHRSPANKGSLVDQAQSRL